MNEAQYTGIGLKALCVLTLRRCRLILLAALIGALLLGSYGGLTYTARQTADNEAALETLQEERELLESNLLIYEKSISKLKRQILEVHFTVKSCQETIASCQARLDGLDAQRADCAAALEKARQALNTASSDAVRVQAAAEIRELNEALTKYAEQELEWRQRVLDCQEMLEEQEDISDQEQRIALREKLLEEKQKELEELDEQIREMENVSVPAYGPAASAIKFAIVGALLFAGLTCGVIAVRGCYDCKLHDGEELASSCGVRLLGDVRRPTETGCPLERRLQRWELGASVPELGELYDQIAAHIRVLTEPGEIVVTGTECGDEETVRELSDRLSPVGYKVTGCADPLKNADALLLAADKPVILVETAGVSDMREVVRLVNLLREGHGSVTGAVIR